ncbi:MAG: ribonuclease D [Chitinophagaceae bacterium]|nr:ribonuclease D [Chitinophagaceae bacterium]
MNSDTVAPPALQYIQDAASLQACIATLQAAPAFAFDLEFDRDRYTYGFDLCLMQIATPATCFLIDPMSGLDLQPLFRVFENPAIRKLVHCPGEDLRLLHSLHCFPTNLADTEVYAKLLNYEQTSLSNMLMLHCGIAIDKKLQTSNWGKRPLTTAQLEYAAADVIYLFGLEAKLQDLVMAKGLMPWVEEELAHLNAARYSLEPKTNFLKKNDLQFMSPYDQFVLNELFKWRDQLARKKNKPAHQIMSEEVLRQIGYGRLPIEQLPLQQGIHPLLKTPGMVRQLERDFDRFHAEARQARLSRKRAGQGLTPEERNTFEQDRLRMEQAKKQVFQPIQQWLTSELGEHTMRFILSGTLINDILRGDTKIGALQPPYRQQLILRAAGALGLDISPWH